MAFRMVKFVSRIITYLICSRQTGRACYLPHTCLPQHHMKHWAKCIARQKLYKSCPVFDTLSCFSKRPPRKTGRACAPAFGPWAGLALPHKKLACRTASLFQAFGLGSARSVKSPNSFASVSRLSHFTNGVRKWNIHPLNFRQLLHSFHNSGVSLKQRVSRSR